MIIQTICDPLKKEISKKEGLRRENLLSIFESFPWDDMLRKMKGVSDDQIYYSPSLGFEDTETGKGITLSIVEILEDAYVFYLFFAQKEEYKSLFGKTKVRETVKELIDQKIEDCIQLIELFQDEHYDSIEEMFQKS